MTVAILLTALGAPLPAATALSKANRPNILLILADDLGFSDLGCYGGEIATPNLDALGSNGLRFSQLYNTARCWPTRASLLTGYYAQHVRRDTLPGIPSGAAGHRPDWAPLLSIPLQSSGYRTYHSGKWHIDGMPLTNGFDRSYYLRDQGRFFHPQSHYLDDQPLDPVPPGSSFYATIAIADHAVTFLQNHSDLHPKDPFFLYLAFTAPHFPLHALPEDIAKYRHAYDAGWEHIRAQRWRRQQAMGLFPDHTILSAVESNVGPPYHFPEALSLLGSNEVNRPLPWDQLTPAQQSFQAQKMSIHAAMIDRMDQEIGRVLGQIKAMNAWENTLILFLSDNGASAEIMVRSNGHDPQAPPGSAASYLCLGPGWSTAANTPFRRHKTWVHEGGITTPGILHWPKGLPASSSGTWRRQPMHVIDITPTLLSLAKAMSPPQPPWSGVNLLPCWRRNEPVAREFLWWSHEGHRALRRHDWKIVTAEENGPWELYDLAQDRTETQDLAAQFPERVRALARQWYAIEQSFIDELQTSP